MTSAVPPPPAPMDAQAATPVDRQWSKGNGQEDRILPRLRRYDRAVVGGVVDVVAEARLLIGDGFRQCEIGFFLRSGADGLGRRGCLLALTPEMLVDDRNFPSWKLWTDCADTGAQLLWRIKVSRLLPRIGTFTDGSWLAALPKPGTGVRVSYEPAQRLAYAVTRSGGRGRPSS